MGERISWNTTVQVTGGPKISLSRTRDIDAYEKISIQIPSSDPPDSVIVEVQPTEIEGQVQFLLIYADHYDSEGHLICGVDNEPSLSGTVILPLDGPQLLIGPGAIGLLGRSPPQDLYFVNTLTDTEVKIDILVGRNAINTS